MSVMSMVMREVVWLLSRPTFPNNAATKVGNKGKLAKF